MKWKDLKEPYLHIRRMEQKQYEQNPDGSWLYHIEVVEHTKSDAGYRTIYVVSSALELFAKIREYNQKHGFSFEAEDYIFATSSIIVSPVIQTSRNVMNWRKP